MKIVEDSLIASRGNNWGLPPSGRRPTRILRVPIVPKETLFMLDGKSEKMYRAEPRLRPYCTSEGYFNDEI